MVEGPPPRVISLDPGVRTFMTWYAPSTSHGVPVVPGGAGQRGTHKQDMRSMWASEQRWGSKVFRCAHCGLVCDRDINGTRNILLRYCTKVATGEFSVCPSRGLLSYKERG